MKRAEYLWIDGGKPVNPERDEKNGVPFAEWERDTKKLRSKTRIVGNGETELEDLPIWGFDGSSTYQSQTGNSDLKLKPVCVVPDPLRDDVDVIVLAEVLNYDSAATPHWSNTRHRLDTVYHRYLEQRPLVGIEQEYTFFRLADRRPLGFPPHGLPEPQGGYYCGIGCDEVTGAEIVEEHTKACMAADLRIHGTNSEVMPGQWEFQIGTSDPLTVADHL